MTVVVERSSTPDVASRGDLRTAGIAALAAALVMVVGAALYFAGGVDPWAAVASGDMAGFLVDASEVTTVLYAGLTAWIFGAIGIGVGGGLLAAHGVGSLAKAARATYTIGAAVAVPGFILLAALVRLAGSGTSSFELADTVAFLGTTIDDVATVILVGLSPFLLSLSSRTTWVPRWLFRWGMLTGAVGAMTVATIYMGASSTVGFAIVPVGIGWLIAAAITAIRHG